jgi:hypothetical protein
VGNGGPAAGVVVAWRRQAPACLTFFSFFRAVSIWVAHGKERVTPSRWGGRQPLFFAVRYMLRTTKTYVVHCLSLRRTTKVFAGQKCVVRPLPCARAESARQRVVPCGFWPLPCAVAHDKACESGSERRCSGYAVVSFIYPLIPISVNCGISYVIIRP